MKVLLTGANGFIGRSVLNLLLSKRITTVVAGRTCPAGVLPNNFLEIDFLGTRDYSELIKAVEATHLLHFAWYTEHGDYWESPLNLDWVSSSVRLAEIFCESGGKKIVYAGTCAEYAWRDEICNEKNTPIEPSSLYGISKDRVRQLVARISAKHKVAFSWGRIFYPYGPGEDRRRLIPALIDVFEGRRPPFGINGGSSRDFLHVEDVAKGFLRLLQSEESGIYNISSGLPIKLSQIVQWLAKSKDADPNVILNLSTCRPGEPAILVGDNKKILDLGWKPTYKLSDLIELGALR